MEIVIDFSPIIEFLSQPTGDILWQLFRTVGWIPIAFTLLHGFKEVWMEYIGNKWGAEQKPILLAIDIPRANTQSPKAVENMFAYLAGAHSTFNLIETYWEGKFQQSFSFEIVSIDGYTQFLIRTPSPFRNLVETSIYSQYPDAEITEVNDYTEGMPRKFPDDDYDIAGMEFIQAKNPAYPIKTYEEFEHKFGEPETHYRDPMAVFMDLCSSLRKGEQLWFQIIVKPIDMFEWTAIGDKEVKSILKEEIPSDKNLADKIGDLILSLLDSFSEFVYRLWGNVEEKKEEKKDDSLKMINLKPKEKKQIEAIHNKIAKIGFNTKMRFVYLAKKDVMNKQKVQSGFVGFMKQFAAMDLNNLKPDTKLTATSVHYFFRNRRLNERKHKLIKNYMGRDGGAGRDMGILNTEELATVWHFPIESVVKAPLIGKAPGRKSEPPSNIPIGEEFVNEDLARPIFEEEVLGQIIEDKEEKNKTEVSAIFEPAANEKGAPPENLPFA